LMRPYIKTWISPVLGLVKVNWCACRNKRRNPWACNFRSNSLSPYLLSQVCELKMSNCILMSIFITLFCVYYWCCLRTRLIR
jgi:hypothetical protein